MDEWYEIRMWNDVYDYWVILDHANIKYKHVPEWFDEHQTLHPKNKLQLVKVEALKTTE